jgi:hypothetical protein
MAMPAVLVRPVEVTQTGRLHVTRSAKEEEDPSLLSGINYPGKHGKLIGVQCRTCCTVG